MNGRMTALVGLCLGAILAIEVYRAIKTRSGRHLAFALVVLVAFSIFLHQLFGFPFPSQIVAKGGNSDLAVAVALFICMLLGMGAQFIHGHFIVPRAERKPFDIGLFVAPVFASPIVFIPLLAALQNADIDLTNLTIPRMMVFLVAFQNGFFWKDFFDKRRRELLDPAETRTASDFRSQQST
jgi:hypothetical protein